MPTLSFDPPRYVTDIMSRLITLTPNGSDTPLSGRWTPEAAVYDEDGARVIVISQGDYSRMTLVLDRQSDTWQNNAGERFKISLSLY